MHGAGPFELLIVVAIFLVIAVGVIGAIVAVAVMLAKKKGKGMMACPKCQQNVFAQATFCPHCGEKMSHGA